VAIVRLSAAELRRLGLTAADLGVDESGYSNTPHAKYHATRTTVDGIRFDSKKEADRYAVLRLLVRAGEIRNLECQAPYPIYVPIFSAEGEVIGLHIVSAYLADFRYRTRRGALVIEDAKGFRTRMYRLKKKAVEAQYGITITEV